jgi:hypothetical protein
VARHALFALGAAVALWLLVPTRSNLNPSRPTLIAITLALTLVSGLALQQALRRESKRLSLVSLTAIVAAAAVILLLAGSLRFGQMAGCGLSALVGVTAASICIRRESPLASLGLPTSLFLVAAMMIGQVNSFSNVPAICYALIAVAPVTLRLSPANGPNEFRAARRWAAIVAPLLVCLVAVGLAAWAELPE